ncbi:uncharacterized protein LOC123549126 [Mercenaria mercenaria]|uniref:uncharacterized protein LOC123549126 n=1 Tax=Mercenaria mercenaria TaxID=6596 RepID=UPI001E1DEAD3|nr:uncharacterized protein LOC123549126 [Mercenaria mercenaria]
MVIRHILVDTSHIRREGNSIDHILLGLGLQERLQWQQLQPQTGRNKCNILCRLPRHRDLLMMSHSGEVHPLGKKLKIITAIVSGKHSKVEAFQQMLQSSSFNLGQQGPVSSTDMHGKNGICGMISGLVIPFIPLKQQ